VTVDRARLEEGGTIDRRDKFSIVTLGDGVRGHAAERESGKDLETSCSLGPKQDPLEALCS
jgi:hypothetical protein